MRCWGKSYHAAIRSVLFGGVQDFFYRQAETPYGPPDRGQTDGHAQGGA